MRRFYISPIIGSGTQSDPYRASAADLLPVNGSTPSGDGHSASIPTEANGLPTYNYAFCSVNASDHTRILADNTISAFPNVSLDTTLSSLTNNQRNAIDNQFTKFGFTRDTPDTGTLQDLLTELGTKLDGSNFQLGNFKGGYN